MSLRGAYTLWAPIYDVLLARGTHALRAHSLVRLGAERERDISLLGIGTGLDLPHLPPGNRYLGVDLTPAMLARARQRAKQLNLPITLQVGDVQHLDLSDASFDTVVMHLILAVVPDPVACLREAARIARPGAHLLILDKFLRPGHPAPLRRLINPLMRRLATRTDVVFENILADTPNLRMLEDRPVAAGGWFREITLERT
ncbi:phosphatidylethanolamine N-methyltransferase [Acidihalobacter yilgarnensis]|uniref:Phosphatidylethanolamine N-methyltransferase n=1 Tax=Acidihalobacter yilgarnensis TaxID=2819280 RepID=A0A1D8IQS8_9GAMM|nr:class I SAM-dependent methyltransferase [Acidihalobacter yilgarnensis]AOU98816.1 phosphatidylethanolamine N-methyltransferase [Acidihalobacter yilgarnensis]